MYKLELKSKAETPIRRLNMVVHAKSRPRCKVLFSLKKHKCSDTRRSSLKFSRDMIKT